MAAASTLEICSISKYSGHEVRRGYLPGRADLDHFTEGLTNERDDSLSGIPRLGSKYLVGQRGRMGEEVSFEAVVEMTLKFLYGI